MNIGRTVFAQLLDFLPQYEFDKCVARYHGNFRVRKLKDPNVKHEAFEDVVQSAQDAAVLVLVY